MKGFYSQKEGEARRYQQKKKKKKKGRVVSSQVFFWGKGKAGIFIM